MSEETIDTPAVTEPTNPSSMDNQSEGVVTEPAKESNTDNQEGQTQVVEEQTPQGQKPYTLEELQNVKNFTELDEKRLPKSVADALAAQKSAQSELTKLQQRQSAQKHPQGRPTDQKLAFTYDVIQAAANGDIITQQQLMRSVDSFIRQKERELSDARFGTDEQSIQKITKEITDAETVKENTDYALARFYQLQQEEQIHNSLNQSIDAEIFKTIPEFDKIAPEIGQFAMTELKFDKDTIENTMDPRIYVEGLMKKHDINRNQATQMAKKFVVQLTKGMHDVYMKMSGKGFQSKELKIPPKIEGGGKNYANESKSSKFSSNDDVEKEIQRIKYGG